MTEYDKITINGNIPQFMKLILLFIDRVGFPILAFCLMFWMSYSSLAKTTDAIASNTQALLEFKSSSKEFQGTVAMEHSKFKDSLDRVYDCCKSK